ncbi:MAG: hypothetical protein H0W28_09925 [Pyrinomonadaceae bacterium]|nr:hypothetical protein [Pyrinomonadaceae bacterium]
MKSLLIATLTIIGLPSMLWAQGSVVVRIEDPVGSHCIDATTETVTIHLRRVFTQKNDNLFTEDKRAGVVLTARLSGTGDQADVDVKLPSVSLVSIKDEKAGRVSLALEYQIARYLQLKSKEGVLTTDMQLSLFAAKKRGKNTFGQILDLAGQALTKLPIPANPYSGAASKFLEFTNNAIDASIAEQQSLPFGEISLAFNRGQQPDLNKCKSAGKERTGAFGVILSTGIKDSELIPTTNTEQLYCFTYNSAATYEMLAAKRVNGVCPANASAYKGVNNDYTMFLMSASANKDILLMNNAQQTKIDESRKRCKAFGLPSEACGVPLR